MMQHDDGTYFDPHNPSEGDLIKHREKWGKDLYYLTHESTYMRDERQQAEGVVRLMEQLQAIGEEKRAFGLRLLEWIQRTNDARDDCGCFVGLYIRDRYSPTGDLHFWQPNNGELERLVEQFHRLDLEQGIQAEEEGAGE